MGERSPTERSVGFAPEGIGAPAPYTLIRELHRGPSATSLLCWEHDPSEQVVVKVAHPGYQSRLQAEYERLQSVTSARVPRPKAVGSDHIALPYLSGHTLDQLPLPLPKDEIVTLATQLLEALDDIHQAGIIHGDLHPGNIVSHLDNWYVVDFDLSDPALKGGHLQYAPPERLGHISNETGPYSDLYSVAKVLEYVGAVEALPYTHEFLDRLGAKDPAARYQTALGALLDLREILDCGGPVVLGLHEQAARLARPSLCGRNSELKALRSAWESALDNCSQTLWVSAQAGLGKSTLATYWSRELTAAQATVLRAYGNSQLNASPLRQWAAHLLQLFPDLAAHPPAQFFLDAHTYPEHALQMALTDLLGRIERPVCLLADDGQWMTAPLLDFARTLPALTQRLLMLVFSRPCELPVDLELQPLSAEDSRSLLQTMAGALPAGTARQLITWARGNPLMLEGALRGLVEKQALQMKEGRWAQTSFDGQMLGRREATWLKRRVLELSSTALETAQAITVLGPTATVKHLETLLGRSPDLEALAQRHLITERGELLTLSHDLITDAVAQTIDPSTLVKLHSRAAEIVDCEFRRAYHWHHAGSADLALSAALKVIPVLLESGRSGECVEAHRIALESLGDGDHTRKASLYGQLSLLLELEGDLAGADDHHKRALEFAKDPQERAALKLREAYRAFLHQAHTEHGITAVREALQLLGEREPHPYLLIPSLIWETANAIGALAKRPPLNISEPDPRISLKAEVMQVGAHLLFMDEPSSLALWYIARSLNLSVKSRSHRSLMWGLNTLAAGMSHQGSHGLAQKIVDASKEMQKPGEDPAVLAVYLTRRAFVEMCRGAVGKSLRTLDAAHLPVYTMNHQWEAAVYEFLRGLAHSIAGNRMQSQKRSQYAYLQSQSYGDTLHIWGSLYSLAYLGVKLPSHNPDVIPGMSFGRTFRDATFGHQAASQGRLAESAAHHVRAADGPHSGWPLALIPGESATAIRRVLLALPPEAQRLRSKMYPHFLKGVKKAKKEGKKYPIAQPLALRETAWRQVFEGDYQAAKRSFKNSANLAEEMGLYNELWHSLKSWDQAGTALKWDPTEWRDRLAAVETRLGITRQEQVAHDQALHLVAQLDSLLKHGQTIVGSLTHMELFTGLKQAVDILFSGPRLGLVTPDGRILYGDLDLPPRTLLQQASDSATVTTLSELPEHNESVVLYGIASTLCAPVSVRGQVIALLWVSHDRVEGLIGEKETAMAQYLATLTGTAWENIERFETLNTQSTELQQLAAKTEAYFQQAQTANAFTDPAGQVDRSNQSWDALGFQPEWWHQTTTHRTVSGTEYLLTQAPAKNGGSLLSATPLPSGETTLLAQRQRERLNHLQSQVQQRALDPLDRFITALDQTDDLGEISRLAQSTIESVSDLVGELMG